MPTMSAIFGPQVPAQDTTMSASSVPWWVHSPHGSCAVRMPVTLGRSRACLTDAGLDGRQGDGHESSCAVER